MSYTSPDNRQSKKQSLSKDRSSKQQMENSSNHPQQQRGSQNKVGAVAADSRGKGVNPKLSLGHLNESGTMEMVGSIDRDNKDQARFSSGVGLNGQMRQSSTIEELQHLPVSDSFLMNNDKAGRSIVSRITRSLGSLKTLSGAGDLMNEGSRNFNLFSHHQLLKDGKDLHLTYDALKEGILELYLSVKIRSDEEIDNYNEEFFNEEKRQLQSVDGFALIDSIKSSIEVLMNMKVEEQDEMENPDLYDGSSNFLRGTINIHEQSMKQPDRRRQSTQEIENKLIDITVGGADKGGKKQPEEIDGEVRVGVPDMDSHESNRGSPERRQVKKPKKLDGEAKVHGLFEQSPSSTVKALQRKLDQVRSPSDSKVSDSQTEDDMSQSSIPPAHKEYEKILQQLEAECRHHIRCEQQMKLHIECLQEKLDAATKDKKVREEEVVNLKKELKTFIDLSMKVEADSVKVQNELQICQKRLSGLVTEKTKLAAKLAEKEKEMKSLGEQFKEQEAASQKKIESLSNNLIFSGHQPVTANSGTHSAQTDLQHLSQKTNKTGHAFMNKSQLSASSVPGHNVKRSLPNYNDIIQKNGLQVAPLVDLKPKPSNRNGSLTRDTQHLRSQSEYLSNSGSPSVKQPQTTGTKTRYQQQRNPSQALINALTSGNTIASKATVVEALIASDRRFSKVSSRSSLQHHSSKNSQPKTVSVTKPGGTGGAQTVQPQNSNPYNMINFASNYQINPMKQQHSGSGFQQASPNSGPANINVSKNNQIVKVVKNSQGVKPSTIGTHKKTKSSYVAAVAQQANSHGIGANPDLPSSSTFYGKNDAGIKRSQSQQRGTVQFTGAPAKSQTFFDYEDKQKQQGRNVNKKSTGGHRQASDVLQQSLSHRQMQPVSTNGYKTISSQEQQALGKIGKNFYSHGSPDQRMEPQKEGLNSNMMMGHKNQGHFASVNVIPQPTNEGKSNQMSKQISVSSKNGKKASQVYPQTGMSSRDPSTKRNGLGRQSPAFAVHHTHNSSMRNSNVRTFDADGQQQYGANQFHVRHKTEISTPNLQQQPSSQQYRHANAISKQKEVLRQLQKQVRQAEVKQDVLPTTSQTANNFHTMTSGVVENKTVDKLRQMVTQDHTPQLKGSKAMAVQNGSSTGELPVQNKTFYNQKRGSSQLQGAQISGMRHHHASHESQTSIGAFGIHVSGQGTAGGPDDKQRKHSKKTGLKRKNMPV